VLRTLLLCRGPITWALAAAVGLYGVWAYPLPRHDVYLALIELQRPTVFRVLVYAYAALWFTTPLVAISLITSLLAIVVFSRPAHLPARALPPYPEPETRPEPTLVLGERHHETTYGRAAAPTWLTIPRRGLYTGVVIVGATGTGKTSACMYPFVDQLLRWRANDPAHRIGGLVMEVKGDFCHQVHDILTRAGRGDDYVEIGLHSDVCYNPLHNTLDPYAVAYAIGTLINNLFGRSKEPFWQQAYVDLLRSVIHLRRLTDGYTTLAEVYRYVLDDTQIDRDLKRLKADCAAPPDVIRVPAHEYHLHCASSPWTLWFEDGEAFAHPYDAELETHLGAQDIAYSVQRPKGAGFAARRHQVEAIDRWFYQSWSRLDTRLRSSIVEGIVVFLGLFDSDPAVYRAFCPPRSAYVGARQADDPRPLPPLSELLEQGRVLALNFPVVLNPALARILAVMLKLDFQRAVLERITRITAAPEQAWRDLLFVADEYHAMATVGETDPTGDERTFALSRQARLMPIVATQSLSSLRSALPGEEAWRTLLQCFRTQLFLATSDEFTARTAAELCARRERLKPRYTLAEAGQGAHISLLSGRPTAAKHTLSASKTYTLEPDYIFPQRTFMELKNAVAVVLPYDGENPLPPQYCYLKPHYRDVNRSYFDQAA
jgi:hypothetical protein